MSGEHFLRSSCRAARLSAAALASFAAVVLAASLPARICYWTNTSSGDWSNATNWSEVSCPTSTDNAWIVNGGTATVTLTAAALQ